MQRDTSASDQELILKKRARRRLVGAIALVVLMVTVLPMVLKDRSQEKAEDHVKINLPGDVVSPEPPQPANETMSDFDSSVTSGETAQETTPQEQEITQHAQSDAVVVATRRGACTGGQSAAG